ALDPPRNSIPLIKPAADRARARQRCRHCIALVPFWTGPTPEGRTILPFPPRPESPTKPGEMVRFLPHARPLQLLIVCRRSRTLQYSNASPPSIRPPAGRTFGRIGELPRMRDFGASGDV